MSEQTATGTQRIIAEGFVAYGESDRSEGRGGRVELGRYTTVEEAIDVARGTGVQSDAGYVNTYQIVLFEGGTVETREQQLIARRRTPEGYYLVGYVDLREYNNEVNND